MKNKIEIRPYDSAWPQFYAEEKTKITGALKDELSAIHHIGSTSIPKMPAKPIIDIMIELKNLDHIHQVKEKIAAIGFKEMYRQIIPHRSFFASRDDAGLSYHLHIYEQGDHQIRRHINFKDYLIFHPVEAEGYAQLKKELAVIHQNDRMAYVSGKDSFVQSVDIKAKKWDVDHSASRHFLPQAAMLDESAWPAKKLLNCIEANFNVSKTFHAQYMSDVILIRKPGYTLVNTGIDDAQYNCVIDADFGAENAHEFISEVVEQFSKIPQSYRWWISPSDQPQNLGELLQANHYQMVASPQMFYLNCQNLKMVDNHKTFKIKNVLEDNVYNDFTRLMTQANDNYSEYFKDLSSIISPADPVEFYVLYDQDEPLACSQVCYYAGVVNIQILTALPAADVAMSIFDYHLQNARSRQYLYAYTYAESIQKELIHQWQQVNHFVVFKA